MSEIKLFQSTLPRGERQLASAERKLADIFQSTLPRGERPTGPLTTFFSRLFQSTLPRGERLCGIVLNAASSDFNPRSHEGSDICLRCNSRGSGNFNPRSHEGSDGDRSHRYSNSNKFQSTLPRGERPYFRFSVWIRYKIFQSTLPRGERRRWKAYNPNPRDFNPRSHEGSDKTSICHLSVAVNFNPRSHEGSDQITRSRNTTAKFQSTLPRGERHRRLSV